MIETGAAAPRVAGRRVRWIGVGVVPVLLSVIALGEAARPRGVSRRQVDGSRGVVSFARPVMTLGDRADADDANLTGDVT